MTDVVLHQFPNGEAIVWHKETKSIAVHFLAPKKVLSTSLLNGGYREDLDAVFNYTCGGPNSCMSLKEFEIHIAQEAAAMGFDPARTTGVGTAALMKNAAVSVKSYGALTVTACVTAGVEGNAGCAGDPAFYYGGEDQEMVKPGTINILLFLGADMPPGVLARAMVTAVEAKTAALRELAVGSRYSREPATGTGTDSMILVADPAAPVYFRGAGKHNKLGELIGLSVKEAVKGALRKQNGLMPAVQHDALERVRRYGITEDLLETIAKENGHEFSIRRAAVFRESWLVLDCTFYIRLLDEFRWGLIEGEEALGMGRHLLDAVAVWGGIPPVVLDSPEEAPMVRALAEVLSRLGSLTDS